MRGSPPAPADEQSALRSIEALIKNYEPQFDLQKAFTPGVLGCSDPQHPTVRREWFRDLDRQRLTLRGSLIPPGYPDHLIYDHRPEADLEWQKIQPADSRFNWRVTVRVTVRARQDYFIHIMAVDKNFERFAFSLQTERDLEEGLKSDCPRPSCHQYKVFNHLSELTPKLDDLYKSFKRQEEERRQQERIDKAVAQERARWENLLAKERAERQLVLYISLACGVAVAILACLWLGLGCTLDDEEGICAGVGMTLFSGVGFLILFLIALCVPWWNRQKSRWRNWRYQRWNERQLREQIYVLYDGKLYIKSAANPLIVAFHYQNPPRFADAVEARAWLEANNKLGNVVESAEPPSLAPTPWGA
jgi:hypothetical protein